MKTNDCATYNDLLREKMALECYDEDEEEQESGWPYGRDERWNESWF